MNISSHRLIVVSGLVWGATFVAARLLLEQPDLSVAARLLLAFGPTVPFVGFMFGAITALREVDELERRIQVESLATAFGLTILLVATLALAQQAGFAKDEDFSFSHIMPMLFLFTWAARSSPGGGTYAKPNEGPAGRNEPDPGRPRRSAWSGPANHQLDRGGQV